MQKHMRARTDIQPTTIAHMHINLHTSTFIHIHTYIQGGPVKCCFYIPLIRIKLSFSKIATFQPNANFHRIFNTTLLFT